MKDKLDSVLLNFEIKLQKILKEFEDVKTNVEAYKEVARREASRENKMLQNRVDALLSKLEAYEERDRKDQSQRLQKKIASTVNIFERVLIEMSMGNPDFDLICRSIIFPFVYERLTDNAYDEGYFLDSASEGCVYAVLLGRDLLKDLKNKHKTDWLEPDTWKTVQGEVKRWWINEGFHHIYEGKYDTMWETDDPYSLTLMQTCQQFPSGENIPIDIIQDKYHVHRRYKDAINDSSNVRMITKEVEEFSPVQDIQEPVSPLHRVLIEHKKMGTGV